MPERPAPTTTTSRCSGVAEVMAASLRHSPNPSLTLHDNPLTLDDMSVIRSAGLRGFRETVVELGGDPVRYAEAAGLPVAALDTDDLLVPDLAMAEVLEIAARELDRPDLGLLIAGRQDLGMLG